MGLMIKAIVTDIEGTTTALTFVKDVLFPYARENLGAFVHDHQDEPEVQKLLLTVAGQLGVELNVDVIVAQLIQWMDEDKKITPLKSLQGLIWEEGYQKGHFIGHVYPDVAKYLQQWHKSGLALYVYSSGSVYAQKLLFAHTEYGDVTPLYSGYFDTETGGKKAASSYRAIAKTIGFSAANILFLSDTKEELDAARASGFATVMLAREPISASGPGHPKAKDFSDVDQMLQAESMG